MKKKLTIKSNVKYNELKQYKKEFMDGEITSKTFQLYLDNVPYQAVIKYGLVRSRTKYDRRYKFKIYLDGIAKKSSDKAIINKLKEMPPSYPIMMIEILFAKEKEEMIIRENGDLEYHFTFLQY